MSQSSRLFLFVLVIALTPALLGQVMLSPNPSRVLGHPQASLVTSNPNYVEGRELFAPLAIAVDRSGTSPIVYVSDTGNNRVLGWRNAAGFSNGAPADIVIGQQDFFATAPQGPNGTFSSGLYGPTGLAVSSSGDLYVADSVNNRVLRYPKPFENPLPAIPDLVIGQLSPSAGTVNYDPDTHTISDRTLKINTGYYTTALLFDPAGNLFVADGGNQRVLRFPASRLGAGADNMPRADLVLGQASATEVSPINPTSMADKSHLAYPFGMAVDSTGRLYVCDNYNRVLVYDAPLSNGPASKKIGGVYNNIGSFQPPTTQTLYQPRSVFLVGDKPYVVDTSNHRIVRFKKYEEWPSDGTAPYAEDLIGQSSLTDYKPNRDALWPVTAIGTEPAVSFNFPVDAAVAGDELFVVDNSNNRVIVLPNPAANVGAAMYGKRVLGQAYLDDDGPNRVEARGFRFGTSVSLDGSTYPLTAGMAVDASSNPPRLYVADTGNNRILGFRDARTAKLGGAADIIIGQESSHRAAENWGPSNPGKPSEYGLNLPQGLAVDSAGNLWVADSANGRVVRYPSPFAAANTPAAGEYRKADLVLGKPNFAATRDSRPDPSDVNFSDPVGVAFTSGGHLVVSDAVFNRVLLFLKPETGFTSGMKANKVFGQSTFTTKTAATSSSDRQHFAQPLQIAVDQGDRLFICDYGLDRVLILDSVTERANGTSADTAITSIGSLGTLYDPRGVYSSAATGETWIASYTSNGYGLLRISGTATAPDFFVGGSSEVPLGVAATGTGVPLVAQSTHRVVFYSPATTATNAANYESELAPGMYATLWPFTGFTFPVTTALAPGIPLPKTLSDVQLLVNDIPSPLHYVSPGQINFLIPQASSTSGDLDVKLVRQSTGEILAVGCSKNSAGTACQSPYLAPQASEYSVGIFTADSSGRNQVRALNVKAADGTYYGGCTGDNITPCLNSSANPVKGGDFVELYLTGQGIDFLGTYEDGAAPGSGHTTKRLPQIYIGPKRTQLPDSSITFSGLSAYYPGLWQINIKIPSGEGAPYGNTVPLEVIYRSSDSWRTNKFLQTIAVSQ